MNDIAISENRALTVQEIKAQIQIIQQVMASVMKKDVHYGTIPGTPKPTLYKPGSELILTTFHIGVDPSEHITDLSTYDEIRYRVAAKGFSQASGHALGFGIGECSSSEEKYKWRKPVCEEEFNETPEDRKRSVWKKGANGAYQLKQVRTNPSDVANTILKMAKKRAQIDMTLTVTAASDVFEQDLEDLPEGLVEERANSDKPPIKEPQKKAQDKKPEGEQVAQFMVKEIQSKKGEKDGKEYTIYTIIDENGTKYGTFSDSHASDASSAKEQELPVSVTYTTGKFGPRISTLEVVIKD